MTAYRSRLALGLAAALVAAGCGGSYSGDPGPGPVGFMGARWSATLTSQPGSPNPRVAGTGTVLSNSDSTQTRVDVTLTGATPDARHPWHLHRGTCGNDLGVVGSGSDYRPLEVGTDGRAMGSATLNVPMPRSGEYMINVHASEVDHATIVACGNLTGPSSGN